MCLVLLGSGFLFRFTVALPDDDEKRDDSENESDDGTPSDALIEEDSGDDDSEEGDEERVDREERRRDVKRRPRHEDEVDGRTENDTEGDTNPGDGMIAVRIEFFPERDCNKSHWNSRENIHVLICTDNWNHS